MSRRDTKNLIGFVLSSKTRFNILKILKKHKYLRQTEIAKKLNQKQQNISKAVFDLFKAGLIESLEPDKKAWKIYTITDLGKETLKTI